MEKAIFSKLYDKSSQIVFALGVVSSIYLFHSYKDHLEHEFAHKFDSKIEKSQILLNTKLEFNNSILSSVKDFFDSSSFVSRDEFQVFTKRIVENSEFIQAIEWIPKVKKEDAVKFIKRAKEDGYKNFYFYDKVNNSLEKSNLKNDYYYPVYYIEPLKGNEKAFGLNLGSNRERLKSLEKSYKSGKITATGKLSLVQENKDHVGFLLFHPVYIDNSKSKSLKNLKGFILGVYKIENMINKMLLPFIPKGLNIIIYDSSLSKDNLLFGKHSKNALATKFSTLLVGQRKWILKWEALPSLKNKTETLKLIFFSIFNFFIFSLLSFVLRGYKRKNEEIKKEVKLRTNEINDIQNALDETANIIEFTSNGSILFANENFSRDSGFTNQQLQDKKLYDLIYKEDIQSSIDNLSQGDIWTGEIRIANNFGGYFWVNASIIPHQKQYLFEEPKRKYTGIFYNITEQKELEKKKNHETKYLIYKDQFAEIFSEVGKDMRNVSSTQEFYKVILRQILEMLGWDFGHILFPESDDQLISSKIYYPVENPSIQKFYTVSSASSIRIGKGLPGRVFATKKPTWMSNIHKKNNDPRYLYLKEMGVESAIGIPILNNIDNNFNILAIIELYNSRPSKKDEAFLEAVNSVINQFGSMIRQHLYQQELSIEKEKAEKFAESKTFFLANMSHEIRTPLNGIIGMVNLLKESELNLKQRDMIDTIQTCGDNLLTILNDILDFSKIEFGKLDLEMVNFSIKSAVKDVIALLEPKAKQNSSHLNFEIDKNVPLYLIGDVTRIRQILVNFVSNAIKFTKNGDITVKVSLAGNEAGLEQVEVIFEVIDTGIGITPEQQKRLFQAFSQADNSTTRKYGGTGLGLSICSKLVDIMNGKISVKSKLGSGSTFKATLPLTIGKSLSPLQQNLDIDKKALKFDKKINHHILVAEDNAINQKIILMILRKLGLSCDLAANGQEALEMMVLKNYSLVFMDLQMPVMGGLEATQIAVERFKENCPVIVAMTANAFKEDKDRCLEVGMKDFLSKPIQVEELKRVLIAYQINDKGNEKAS